MSIPSELFYTAEHEWVAHPSGPQARVGITEYAATTLGDIVFVDLPEFGQHVKAGEACGEIESTKSTSELYSPVSGRVIGVNERVVDAPELVNDDPYGEGWLFVVEAVAPLPALLDANAYAALPDVAK
ncbi:MAG: glycine cleavage system protein GcvH [Bifidobacteriaceae bacterium]|jgi:glycine cleavage system H protein|nr:glycine cleavage system protein GcvH [Bifidobacteriaceae bacterium]